MNLHKELVELHTAVTGYNICAGDGKEVRDLIRSKLSAWNMRSPTAPYRPRSSSLPKGAIKAVETTYNNITRPPADTVFQTVTTPTEVNYLSVLLEAVIIIGFVDTLVVNAEPSTDEQTLEFWCGYEGKLTIETKKLETAFDNFNYASGLLYAALTRIGETGDYELVTSTLCAAVMLCAHHGLEILDIIGDHYNFSQGMKNEKG